MDRVTLPRALDSPHVLIDVRERETRRGPLWKFMPTEVRFVPAVRPPVNPNRPPREITPEDLAPLREDGVWSPAEILARLGPARSGWEYLARIIVGAAVFQGPHKIHKMTERLGTLAQKALFRLERMIEEEALAYYKPRLEDIRNRCVAARQDLPETRARAANELDEMLHPDGLRMIDLDMLTSHIMAVIGGSEIATKRNGTGIDYAFAIISTPPDLRFAEEWVDRAIGLPLQDVMLLWPREWARVLLVTYDGRLAYDPGAPSSEEA